MRGTPPPLSHHGYAQLDATEAEVQIDQALDVQGNDLIAVVVLPRLGVSHSVSQSVS